MAYKERYRFTFDSQAGRQCSIRLYEDGYTGNLTSRPLGSSPKLMLEQSECVRGSSLSFEAECVVEDEFADLYTSDPLKYKVEVYAPGLVWEGYITPELYSAPWIDPPYNVTLTATDGLGELKRYEFPKRGRQTLSSHLAYLLGKTGFTYPIDAISTLKATGSTAALFFSEKIDLDSHAGETCYDVLQGLLRSMHATVLRSPCNTAMTNPSLWLIMRETDVEASISGSTVTDMGGDAFPIVPFGSMKTNAVWPVGQLNMEIEPARNSLKVVCPNVYASDLISSDVLSWSGTAATRGEERQMGAGQYITATASLPTTAKGPDLKMTVKARYSETTSGILGVKVKMTGKQGSTTKTYYLGPVSFNGRGDSNAPAWVTTETVYSVTVEAGNDNSSSDLKDYEVVLPFTVSGRQASSLDTITSLAVTLSNASDTGTLSVSSVTLDTVGLYNTLTTSVTLGNGARGEGDEISAITADTVATNCFLGYLLNAFSTGVNWQTSKVASSAWGAFLASDYALSVALPRLRLKGTLNVATDVLPMFWTTGGLRYITEQLTWDMYLDEVEVSMLSLPAASISVSAISTYTDTGSEASGTLVTPTQFDIDADDTSAHLIDIYKSGSWTVSNSTSWLSFSKTSGSGNTTISFAASKNTSTSRSRTGTATVAGVTIKVVQAAAVAADSISVSASPLSLASTSGASGKVTVAATNPWTLTGLPSWLTASAESGTSGSTALTLTASSANNGASSRSASLTLTTSKGASTTLTVSQASATAADSISVSPKVLSFLGNAGASDKVTVTANNSWYLTGLPTWLKASATGGASGSIVLTFTTASANTSGSRTAALGLITVGGATASLTISQETQQVTDSISVTPAGVTLDGASGQTTTATVTASNPWSLTGLPSWLSASVQSGAAGSTTVVLTTLSANAGEQDRSASLTLATSAGASASLSVTQSATPATDTISVTPGSLSLSGQGDSTDTVVVVSSAAWTLSGLPSWLTASAQSGAAGNTSLVISTASANTTGDVRSVTLTLTTAGGQTAYLSVEQQTVASTEAFAYFSPDTLTLPGFSGRSVQASVVKQNIDNQDITCDASWLGLLGTSGDTLTVYTKEANTTGAARAAVVTGMFISNNGESFTAYLTVIQQAQSS